MEKTEKKLEKFPKDWETHILKGCELYFYDKNIEYISGFISHMVSLCTVKNIFNFDYKEEDNGVSEYNSQLELLFRANDKEYLVDVAFNNLTKSVHGLVVNTKKLTNEFGMNYMVMVGGFKALTCFGTLQSIEIIISEDKSDDDNGDDDFSDDPIEPIEDFSVFPTKICS